jgi:hypothetical protein
MGFGVFMIGQTVPPNFFKKYFLRKKLRLQKIVLKEKHYATRIRVVKKPVLYRSGKKFGADDKLSQEIKTFCSTNGIDYTYTGNSIRSNDKLCWRVYKLALILQAGAGVNPNIGSGIATLNNAIFNVGPNNCNLGID